MRLRPTVRLVTLRGAAAALALAAGGPSARVAAQQPAGGSPLWGRLERGPYDVGFRQLLLRDVSRPALAAEDGAAVPTTRGRQMQIALWYPARARAGETPIRYGAYIDMLAQELDFAPLTAVRRARAVETFMTQSADHSGDTATLRRALPSLSALPTAARLNARPAVGRFPLVLYPAWRSPASNSILAEYLASHGYVVASSTLKGTFDAMPETSVRGLETHAADLRFIIASLDSMAFIDVDRVAPMGVGVAASGALALQMRTPAVRALVSLEGGITTPLEVGLIAATPYFDIGAVRVPMLAITAPHPSVDPARLDVYRFSTRHLVHFPRMGEHWFLNFGMLERHAPRIIGNPPGDVATGFEWGARWVRAFLDAYLRDNSAARALLATGRRLEGAPDGVFTVAVRPGLPAPPTLAELKQIIVRDGGRGLAALVDQRRRADSQSIPADYFVALSSWLVNSGRDAGGTLRYDIATQRAAMYPQSARARFTLGMSASARGDSVTARAQLTEALRLLPDDVDPALDATTRARIERQARDALARLGTGAR